MILVLEGVEQAVHILSHGEDRGGLAVRGDVEALKLHVSSALLQLLSADTCSTEKRMEVRRGLMNAELKQGVRPTGSAARISRQMP
jgi:hypothetical protein